MLTRIKEILDSEIAALRDMPLDEEIIKKTVDMLVNCKGSVVVSGIGKAGIIGRKISSTFSSVGIPSFFLHPAESFHGDLGSLKNDNIIIVLSNSGKTKEIILMLKLIKATFSCKIIGITSSDTAKINQYCDLIINIGKSVEVDQFNLMPSISTTKMSIVGDILASLASEQKEFSIEKYSKFHHSGYIGKLLKEKIDNVK